MIKGLTTRHTVTGNRIRMGPPTATMDVDTSSGVEESKASGRPKNTTTEEQPQEELPDPLKEALEAAEETAATNPKAGIEAYHAVLATPGRESDEAAQRIKEEAIYRLARLHANAHEFTEVMALLQTANAFFAVVPKAKTAKIVRTIIDIVAKVPDSVPLQIELCRQVVAWCNAQKRTFLRQRIESRLAALLFEQGDYSEALNLVNKLLRELKKFDDKQLLVETHLIEARIHHALRNLPKAKAALTAARTAGNAIYVVPLMQAELDQTSGVLHCEEGDYKTAHSYFLEAFEAYDQLSDPRAVKCLQYMMLCSILQGAPAEVSGITSKHGLKYTGAPMAALVAIANAAKDRSLEAFDAARAAHGAQLAGDLLVKHHIHIVYDQLLEANLLKIIEPFSCVEITHVAELIALPEAQVEKKLSQMILDNKILGTLDQGRGQLLIYEPTAKDKTFEHGLDVISNLGLVVDSLFRRAQRLATHSHVVGSGAAVAPAAAPAASS